MLSALIAVLALAGAPATTSVDCGLPGSVEFGLTVSDTAQIIDGKATPRRLDHIFLGTLGCGGLLYGSESVSERLLTRQMNPGVDFDRLLGVGLQVALHEAEHVALNSGDECLVEKTTRAKIDGLIEKLGDQGRVAAEEADATASDALLPASYHGC